MYVTYLNSESSLPKLLLLVDDAEDAVSYQMETHNAQVSSLSWYITMIGTEARRLGLSIEHVLRITELPGAFEKQLAEAMKQ